MYIDEPQHKTNGFEFPAAFTGNQGFNDQFSQISSSNLVAQLAKELYLKADDGGFESCQGFSSFSYRTTAKWREI